jgi:hypothetical protein
MTARDARADHVGRPLRPPPLLEAADRLGALAPGESRAMLGLSEGQADELRAAEDSASWRKSESATWDCIGADRRPGGSARRRHRRFSGQRSAQGQCWIGGPEAHVWLGGNARGNNTRPARGRAEVQAMRGIKHTLDPTWAMNPGCVGPTVSRAGGRRICRGLPALSSPGLEQNDHHQTRAPGGLQGDG